jgi:hypothetical protein
MNPRLFLSTANNHNLANLQEASVSPVCSRPSKVQRVYGIPSLLMFPDTELSQLANVLYEDSKPCFYDG